MLYNKHKIFTHDLLQDPYISPINDLGSIDDLIKKVGNSKRTYPKLSALLEIFLITNQQITTLEDWLIITPYRLLWQNNKLGLEWFENQFENASNISPGSWEVWLQEVAQKCHTTNYLFDRFYQYLLHLYGIPILHAQGFHSINFPVQGTGVDIEAMHGSTPYAIESKFIKTSDKFRSFYSRFSRVQSSFGHKVPSIIDLLNFPNSKNIRALNQNDMKAMKEFSWTIGDNLEATHIGTYKSMHTDGEHEFQFSYSPDLGSFPITIENQIQYAREAAMFFLNNVLCATISKAIKQLNDGKYHQYRKCIVIGVQWDFELTSPWAKQTIQEIKTICIETFKKQNIHIMFSEDYGYSMAGYL